MPGLDHDRATSTGHVDAVRTGMIVEVRSARPPDGIVTRHGEAATVDLPDNVLALLAQPSTCYLATVMPDGSPQLTQTWVDTDGQRVLINTVETHQKVANIRRDPRVALTISDPATPSSYVGLRGRVTSMTSEGATDHIEKLSHRYLGRPYPWFGGRDQVRVLLVIDVDKVSPA